MTIDDKCKHVPKRLYIWPIPEIPQTLYMATCNKCGTDYAMKRIEYAKATLKMLYEKYRLRMK